MSQNLFSIFTDHPEAIEKILEAIWEDGRKWYLIKKALSIGSIVTFRFNDKTFTVEELDELAAEVDYETFREFLIGTYEKVD